MYGGLATAVAVASAWVAFSQPARPDPFRPANLLTEWWRYPLQANAFARADVIQGDLNAVFAGPGGNRVWAVGDGGLLIYSTDGGVTWRQGTIVGDSALFGEGAADPAGPGDFFVDSAAVGAEAVEVSRAMPRRTSASLGFMGTGLAGRLLGGGVQEQMQDAREQQAPPREQRTPPGAQELASSPPPPSEEGGSLDERLGAVFDTTRAPDARPTLAHLSYFDVHFIDDRRGRTVGEMGVLLTTSDGGATWRLTSRTPGVGTWRRVHEAAGKVWAEGDLGWHVSDDGGETWRYASSVREGGGTSTLLLRESGTRVTLSPDRIAFETAADGDGNDLSFGAGEPLRLLAVHEASGSIWVGKQEGARDSIFFIGSTPAPSQSGPSVRFVPFPRPVAATTPDGLRGVVALADGRIVRTAGIDEWETVWTGDSPLTAMHFADPSRGWAVGAGGTVLSTRNGGRTWQLRAGGRDRIHAVEMTSATEGWAVGSGGAMLSTRNGGRTWTPRESPTAGTLTDVHFRDARRGVAIGENTVLQTENGGLSWEVIRIPAAGGPPPRMAAVYATDSAGWWAVGANGLVLQRAEGTPWVEQEIAPGEGLDEIDLHSVHFPSPRRGWIGADLGVIYVTEDAGRTWTLAQSEAVGPVVAFAGSGEGSGWAVTRLGAILGTRDGGREWTVLRWEPAQELTSVHFLDDATGWAAGLDGLLLATSDSGRTWTRADTAAGPDILALAGIGDGEVLAAGKGGALLRLSSDGKWTRAAAPGRWWPAPWYLLSWLLVLGLVVRAFPRREEEVSQESIADVLVSDRPLERGDPDPVRLNDVALGLSRFLRNERTEPPLTIGILGKWGTGKSSLMNLVRADLRHYGFRPVWFNAWHHQTEEHLLAAFLETVRQQAIPSWWSVAGLRFRGQLLAIRLGRHRPLAAVGLLGVALYAGYLAGDASRWMAVRGALAAAFPTGAESGDFFASLTSWFTGLLPGEAGQGSGLMVVLTALGVLATVARGIRAFGVKPANLLATVGRSMRPRELQAQTSFRHRFAREFDEVTRALRPRDMVIFVDDLDRCRSQHVLEVLEAINFLVSSGRCVVIMGMDFDRVLQCVGREFEKEAEDVAGVENGADEDRRKARRDYARAYLEKLVNIEVPVPQVSSDHIRELLAPTEAPARTRGRAQRIAIGAMQISRPFAPAMAALLVLAFAFQVGRTSFGTVPAADAGAVAATALGPGAAPEATRPDARPTRESDDVLPTMRRSGRLIAAAPVERGRGILWLGLGAALAVGAVRLLDRPEVVVKDSRTFRHALSAWGPYLAQHRETPRAAKKFLNRVRYYAMRQTLYERPEAVWQRLARQLYRRPLLRSWLVRLGFQEPGVSTAHEALGEELLVALAAIHECEPAALEEDATFRNFGSYLAGVAQRFPACAEALRNLHYPTSIDDEARRRFAAVAAGIRTR